MDDMEKSLVNLKEKVKEIKNILEKPWKIKIDNSDVDVFAKKIEKLYDGQSELYSKINSNLKGNFSEEFSNMFANIEEAKNRIINDLKNTGFSEGTVKKQFTYDKRLYQNASKSFDFSAEDKIEMLEVLLAKYQDYKVMAVEIEKEIYSARKEIANKWYQEESGILKSMMQARDNKVDYSAVVLEAQALKEKLLEEYKEFPELLANVWDEVSEIELEAFRRRSDKILDMQKEELDSYFDNLDNYAKLMREQDGLVLGDGSIFSFDTSDEKKLYEDKVAAVNIMLEKIEDSVDGNLKLLTDKEDEYYFELIKKRENYLLQVEIFNIRLLKEEQENLEKLKKESIKNEEEKLKNLEDSINKQLSLEKDKTKELKSEIEKRKNEEIAAIKEAGNAEISEYQERIKEIDKLIKRKNIDEKDEDYEDKIIRLKELLKYEIDEKNAYELNKEIDNLEKEYQKRKEREKLEAEKDSLQEEISNLNKHTNDRIEEIKNAASKELKIADEKYKNLENMLEIELENEKQSHIQISEFIEKEYQKRIKSLDNSYKTQNKLSSSFLNNEYSAFSSYIIKIVSEFNSKIQDFSDAGYRAGSAYRESFMSAAGDVFSPIGYRDSSQASNNTFSISNNFNTQVTSPYDIARASKKTAEELARVLR